MRFDPSRPEEDDRAAALEEQILADLDAVVSLDDDRILRGFLGLIQATVRTNAYVRGGQSEHISFKFRCADVPGMPKPVPLWEIFVFSPEMEGVHLRGGFVARGGIRWSDRLEDYRTEILGLMKAQMVKNAVIVPVGAKGGFVLKRPPADRAELLEEERRQYITLMRGMLDLTDNIVGGEIVHPPDVRVLDEVGDAYLVVAADKGTAHLSDTANEVSAEYGHWLGDAFASGGSTGYDHKALGITARGAWESVQAPLPRVGPRRYDRARSPSSASATCRETCSATACCFRRHLRLVAAFDHRHVFVDPDPDRRIGARRAPAAVRPARVELGRLRPVADLGGRRRLAAVGQVGAGVGRGARRAGGGGCACRRPSSARRCCGLPSTCSGTAASAPS